MPVWRRRGRLGAAGCWVGVCFAAGALAASAATPSASSRFLGPLPALKPPPPAVTERAARLRQRLVPSAALKLAAAARRVAQEAAIKTPEQSLAAAQQLAAGLVSPSATRGDVDVLAFLVLIGASEEMDHELALVANEVRAMTVAKQQIRDRQEKLALMLAHHHVEAPLPATPGEERGRGERLALQRQVSPLLNLAYVHPPELPALPAAPDQLSSDELRRRWRQLSDLEAVSEDSEVTALRLQSAAESRDRLVAMLAEREGHLEASADAVVSGLR